MLWHYGQPPGAVPGAFGTAAHFLTVFAFAGAIRAAALPAERARRFAPA